MNRKYTLIIFFCLLISTVFSQNCYRVYVNITADYTFYEMSNFDDEFTENIMNDSFNYAAQIFEQYGIHLVKGEFKTIKNEGNDPYTNLEKTNGKFDANDMFSVMNGEHKTVGGNDFGMNPYTSELGFAYDIDALFTGAFYKDSLNEELSGVVNQRGNLYTDSAYFLIRHVIPNQFNILPETFAHEIGHVLGGEHCDAIWFSRFRNCENNETSPAPVVESLMKPGCCIGDELPILSPNNLQNLRDLFNYHKDFVYTSDTSPFPELVDVSKSEIHQTTGILTVNSSVTTSGSNSTTLLLKSSEVIKSTGQAKFIPQGSTKIRMIIDPDLNDYCSSSTNTSSLRVASLNTEEENKIKEFSVNYISDKVIKLYPNPTTNYVNIDFSLTDKSVVKVSVFDYVGRYLFDLDNKELNSGSHQKQYDISNLSMGMYVVKVNTINGSKSFQIIKN